MASARAAHVARRAADFGVVIGGDVGVDMARVKARKDSIVRRSATGVERWLKSLDNCTVYQAHGRFDGGHRVRVGDEVLEAERIFINVGARAFVPPFPGVEEVDYLTNSSIMELDSLPEHLVIVGGGYIGLEFAQMFRRFGSVVTLIDRGERLIKRESADVSAAVCGNPGGRGSAVPAGGRVPRLRAPRGGGGGHPGVPRPGAGGGRLAPAAGGGAAPQHRRPGAGDHRHRGERARSHPGRRRPADRSARRVGARRVQRPRRLHPHRLPRLRDRPPATCCTATRGGVSDRIDCYALYIDPPLGRVGMTEPQVRASGRPALVATRPMTRVGRAVEKSETQGFMKVLVDAETERILGAAILGVGGDEVIHSILDVMYADAPYTVIRRAVHIHPTVAELIPTMLADLKLLE